MTLRVLHKTEGWTATMEIDGGHETAQSSRVLTWQITAFIIQDMYDESGRYHEDPRIESLDELELLSVLERPTSDQKHEG